MVARVLWRSEARSQGTTLSVTDLYNASTAILSPFF